MAWGHDHKSLMEREFGKVLRRGENQEYHKYGARFRNLERRGSRLRNSQIGRDLVRIRRRTPLDPLGLYECIRIESDMIKELDRAGHRVVMSTTCAK